jgi:hypothetical protein
MLHSQALAPGIVAGLFAPEGAGRPAFHRAPPCRLSNVSSATSLDLAE